MPWFNSTLAAILPYCPRLLVRPFASPYVAGETTDSALSVTQTLNSQGFVTTIDILGEHVQSQEESRRIQAAYSQLYDLIANDQLNTNISLKLTHLGLEIDPMLAEGNVLAILSKAKERGNFLRIDMENSPYTDQTIRIYKRCYKEYQQVGMVLQSYLRRSLNDLKELNSPAFNCRICKGIYQESPSIAYQDRQEIRDNFVALVQNLLTGGGYAAIATHDLTLIDTIETWIENKDIPPNRFEFQVLYGVPMGRRLDQLLAKGYTVRVYIPFGQSWFEYSIRRLKENPNILGYILHNIIKRKTLR